MENYASAIICAAGSSSRMGSVKKEFLPFLPGQAFSPESNAITVLETVINVFASCPEINPIIVCLPPSAEIPPHSFTGDGKNVFYCSGGASRRISVHNALLFLQSLKIHQISHVLIQDGARPWIKRDLIERIIEGAVKYGAAIPGLPMFETPKELDGNLGETAFVKQHLRRSNLCSVQTPQGFAFPEILFAHERAGEKENRENFEYTDDAEVWGEFSGQVAVIPGDRENKKITYPEDLRIQKEGAKSMQRIGLGRDLHRLVYGRKFLLGGVCIPFEKGELGHSDGDVLAHAVIDAVLGAAALGDIGELYPAGDPEWKDADSLNLLERAWGEVKKLGWHLVNLDCTIVCEEPKILPYRDKIRQSLADALGADMASVFVKGKTSEGIGFIGRGEAVEATAICLIERAETEK